MKKIRLVGVSYEKQLLLDTLANTGAVQIKCTEADWLSAQEDSCVVVATDKVNKVKRAIELLETTAKKHIKGFVSLNEPLSMRFDDFLAIMDNEQELEQILAKIEQIFANMQEHQQQLQKLSSHLAQIQAFDALPVCFSDIRPTKNTYMTLGTLPTEAYGKLTEFVAKEEVLAVVHKLSENEQGVVVFVDCHNGCREVVLQKLAELNFVKCPFDYAQTPKHKINQISSQIAKIYARDQVLLKNLLGFVDKLNELRLYCDRLEFEYQKQAYSVGFDSTATTFTLEAYCPVDKEQKVVDALKSVSDAIYLVVEEVPDDDDCVPTLMQNNPVVKQFEFVTNMYSPPAYREYDPNGIMSFFFAIFFGFIMADMGYGLLLTIGGFLLAKKMKRDTGMRRLVYIIATGGIFAVIFGALFGSLFGINRSFSGFEWLPKAIIPDPVTNSSEVLMYSLLFGAVHLGMGYFTQGLTHTKQGRFWDGVWDGFVWSLFFVGLILLFPFIGQMLFSTTIFGMEQIPPVLTYVGVGICVGVVAIEIFASGRHAKGFGKAIKAFSSVYGLINFFSDLLSYARLFGLMLSGAMIASIVSEMSIGLMQNGVIGILGGTLVMLVGHGFNLAMGVLGAYVHNARLQFIEYFGKFYEGNGELFTPIGSNLNYTILETNK
ncbi:MAG: hypothetical protein IKV38_02815 [Clostridia bacterium]|nr:hypothetical protein [Clostridia bacterium]